CGILWCSCRLIVDGWCYCYQTLDAFLCFITSLCTGFSFLSLHDALPISADLGQLVHQMLLVLKPSGGVDDEHVLAGRLQNKQHLDRKSTRLNSSHLGISYAVFCLKKKKN